MNEAPKKIWMTEHLQAWTTRDDMFNTPYIRADLVNELVAALEELMYARSDKAEQMAEAALKKLEEK